MSRPHPRSICIVNFTGYRANWGCQATSWELLKFINGCFRGGPLPRVSFVPLLWRSDFDTDLDRRLDDIYEAIGAVSEGSADADRMLRFLEDICLERYGSYIEDVRSADLVVFQGEGTMSGRPDFHSGAGFLLLPFVAKRAWGKPVFSLNQSIFGRDPDLLTAVTRIFNSFDFTAVREGASVEFARRLGITPCHYVPDAAFLTKPSHDARLPRLNSSQRYFCVTNSALREPQADERILNLADRLHLETGLTPILAVSKNKRFERLARRMWPSDRYKSVPQSVHYPAVAHVLQHCAFLLGGRYHMAIMAAAVGTPTLLLRGNTFKNEGLAAMLSAPFPVRAFDDADAIVSDAHMLLGDLAGARRRLESAVTLVRASLRKAQDLLTGALAHEATCRAISTQLPSIEVPSEIVDYYVAAALTKGNKAAKRKTTTAEDRFGRRPSPEEILRPLLAGLQGDPAATKAALKQILEQDPSLASRCPPAVVRQLATLSLLDSPRT